MTPEEEVIDDLLDQLERIARGATDDQEMLGVPPGSVAEFAAMPTFKRTACKALLKSFEQYVDTLQRIIRTELRITGFRLKGMTPLDVANKAEELGQITDALSFLALIKLRNEFAHEYPDDAETRFDRLNKAISGLPFLDDSAARVKLFAQTRLPGAAR